MAVYQNGIGCGSKQWVIKKAQVTMLGLFRILALPPGLEPGTCGLTVRRSTDWAIGESEMQYREIYTSVKLQC